MYAHWSWVSDNLATIVMPPRPQPTLDTLMLRGMASLPCCEGYISTILLTLLESIHPRIPVLHVPEMRTMRSFKHLHDAQQDVQYRRSPSGHCSIGVARLGDPGLPVTSTSGAFSLHFSPFQILQHEMLPDAPSTPLMFSSSQARYPLA